MNELEEKLIEYNEMMNPSYFVLLLKKGKYYYFLGSDKVSLTRNVEEAYHLKNDGTYTVYGYAYEIRKNWVLPDGYSLYHLMNRYDAQKVIDTIYPLPRKSVSKKVRKEVFNMFNGHCAYCGCEINEVKFDVDHITSHMMNKGNDDISNYYPACKDCNKFKSCSTIEQFRNAIKDTVRVCSKRNTNYLWDRIYRKYGLDKNPGKEIKFYFEVLDNAR